LRRTELCSGWHGTHLRPWPKPDPGPPGVRSRCTDVRVNTAGLHVPPGCTPRLQWQWGSVVACCSTAVTRALLEDTGLQSRAARPTTGGCSPTEAPTTDPRACTNGPIFHLYPGPVQPPPSSHYELDRPGCDTRPLLARGGHFFPGTRGGRPGGPALPFSAPSPR
jgi:hypothetical protein